MKSKVLESVGDRRKFLLVLAPGEEAVASITQFSKNEGIEGASVSGIGAFSDSSLGYFNPSTKEFTQNDINEQTEVLSMIGNIAVQDGEGIHLHIHTVLGCRDGTTRGGHLVSGNVNPTMELIIEEHEAHMARGVDSATGFVLLQP
jgi:predicted DNA-binding protein with PD1-like motif